MAEAFADRVYLARIIGGVHEIVEVHDAPGGHGGQGDGGLGVVDGCRGEDGADRHTAVGGVDMELVSPPGLQDAPGVLLRPLVAELREVVEHRVQAHAVRLPFETGRRLRPLGHIEAAERETLETLNRSLWAWIEGEYHHTPHRGLDGRTPLEQWALASGAIRYPDATLGRSEAQEPQSGLTRRRPSDTPAPSTPSGNDPSVREIKPGIA